MKQTVILLATVFVILAFPRAVGAHEAYVLTPEQMKAGLSTTGGNPLTLLGVFLGPAYLPVTIVVSAILAVLYAGNFLLATSKLGGAADKFIKRGKDWGLLVVRLALAASFLFGAANNSIFGPEISLSAVPFGHWILPLKVILGVMFLTGLMTEAAAVVGAVIFFLVLSASGQYTLTYLNYLGELLALAIFGSRFLSVDGWLLKEKRWTWVKKLRDYEVPIVRIGLGLALIYTAVNIKFLHPMLPVAVVDQYGLRQYFFGWSAEYVAVGAGMVELMIGGLILVGLAQRLTVVIFMAFITLSLLYFREAVWPHLMLYGIAVMIFVNNADRLTMDRWLIPKLREAFSYFQRRAGDEEKRR